MQPSSYPPPSVGTMPPPAAPYPPALYPPTGYPPTAYPPTGYPPTAPKAGGAPQFTGLRLAAVVLALIIVAGIVESLLPSSVAAARKLAYPQPEVSISPSTAQTIAIGSSITFTATVNAGRDLKFSWDFGDGGSGSGATVSHQYSSDSTQEQNNQFTVQLTATDPLGQANTATVAVMVLPAAPQASFFATQDSFSSDCYQFDGSNSQGYQLTYAWDFGDGGTDTSGDAQPFYCYSFDAVGSYTVTLTVTDPFNRTSTDTHSVYNPGF